MKILIKLLVFSILMQVFLCANSFAEYTENDLLLDKMVEKGYLTYVEAENLKQDTRAYVAKQMAKGEMGTLPSWVQTLQVKGDIRLRTHYRTREGVNVSDKGFKGRAKLGVIGNLDNKYYAGIGLATSDGGNPRSADIKFGDTFEKRDIRLDYLYVEAQPIGWAKGIIGQFNKDGYLWAPSDLLWDNDINPVGGSIRLEFPEFERDLKHPYKMFLNAGYWTIDEIVSVQRDPALTYLQPGISYKGPEIDATATANLYYFHYLRGAQLDWSAGTNSGMRIVGTSVLGTLDYNFKNIGGSMEIGYTKMIGDYYRRFAMFGDFTRNTFAPEDQNTGWAIGLKAGDPIVDALYKWQVKYQYSYLEKDAFPDVFPDSDRYEGRTGIQGHSAKLSLGMAKNTTLNFTWYRTRLIANSNPQPESLYMFDIMLRI
jgi:hypothetical protein